MKDWTGASNPNFGNKWSEEQKTRQSDLIKSKVNDQYRLNCSKANKGKKFSEERCLNISIGHLGLSYPNRHSKDSKKKIGIKSKERFTNEFLINRRKIMEERGHWIPLKDKSNFEIYFKEADWRERMWDRFEDERLTTTGIFNMKTNTKGLVRDHIFSRRSGFNQGIFPEILRHPANCQLLTHSDNIRKKKCQYVDDDQIEIDVLFDKIEKYDKVWEEQQLVLNKIKEYKLGHRYIRKGVS